MRKLDQQGNVLVTVLLAVFVVLFFVASGFGVWAFGSRNDYKQNVDQKINVAVENAIQKNSEEKDKEFAEREKNPFRTYTGPSAYGTVGVTYPKTWSAYVDESGKTGNTPLTGYFNPSVVPGLQSGSSFAIRVQVSNTQYANDIRQIESSIKSGKAQAAPYSAPKVPDVIGLRVTGEIQPNKQGVLIILPLRDKTLRVWTESNDFVGDLDSIILANLTFVP